MRSKTFAIYHTWPDLRNAEFEVIQRILTASHGIGKSAVVIDNCGNIIWSSPELAIRKGDRLNPDDVNFAISLHFESPRVCDVYTYYALWQPIEFYSDFGYDKSLDKFSTHNDLLSCHSDIADDHALNIFNGLGRPPLTPLPTLFHTLPEPFLEPHIRADATLFYVGINWERIGRPKGRYHDLLAKLDEKELVRIYGPEEIQGVAPWAGFKTYSGELPFDGVSITRAINGCGVCLALSSKAHKSTGIMSNRLFEGLASGAAVIATPNALIDKYFRDVVYVVDDSRGEAFLEQQINSVLREIRRTPDAAEARVLAGQEILRKVCSLEGSIERLFEDTERRRRHFYNNSLSSSSVNVILLIEEGDLYLSIQRIIQLNKQMLTDVYVNVIVGKHLSYDLDVEAKKLDWRSLKSLSIHEFEFDPSPDEFEGVIGKSPAIGPLISRIVSGITTPYFAIFNQSDEIFHDHFASLARAVEAVPGAACAVSGSLVRSRDAKGKEYCHLLELRVGDPESLVRLEGGLRAGRFLFSSSVISEAFASLMNLLDGEEHSLFIVAALLRGPLANSAYATHIDDQIAPVSIREPAHSVALQRQFIRDHFSGDSRWLEHMARSGVQSMAQPQRSATPIRWETYHTRKPGTRRLEIERTYETKIDGSGVDFLVSGFFQPEAGAVWMGPERAVIEFLLPRHTAEHIEDYRIVLQMAGRQSAATGREQHCTFILNQMAIAYCAVPRQSSSINLKIPHNILQETSKFRLEIAADHAEVVQDDLGNVLDYRNLSALIYSFSVVRDRSDRLPLLQLNTAYPLCEGQDVTRALVHGFYGPEHNLTWICGLRGEIRFRFGGDRKQAILQIKLAGRPANEGGAVQEIHLTLNDHRLGFVQVDDEPRLFSFQIEAGLLYDTNSLVLEAAHADPVVDAWGSIVDPRLLGAAVIEIGISEPSAVNAQGLPKGMWTVRERLKRAFRRGE